MQIGLENAFNQVQSDPEFSLNSTQHCELMKVFEHEEGFSSFTKVERRLWNLVFCRCLELPRPN